MESDTYDPKNPFFKNAVDKLCGLCSKRLEINSTCSLNQEITPNASTSAYQVLESFSNFKLYENGPQSLCVTCFNNTVNAFRFQQICNKAQMYFDNYLKHQQMLSEQEEHNAEVKSEPSESSHSESEDLEITETTIEINEIKINTQATNTGSEEVAAVETAPSAPTSILRKLKTPADYRCEEVEPVDPQHKPSKKNPYRKMRCLVCRKLIAYCNMRPHSRIHTGEKPFKCKLCDKDFTQRTSLHSHMDWHENKRELLCKFCGKAFNHRSMLRNHEKTHTGEKPHVCQHCGKAFITTCRLARHMVVHTGEKAFTCEYCAKSFNRRSNMKVHLKIHTGERPHVCQLCGKSFIQAHCLRSHLNTHVKEDAKLAGIDNENTTMDEDSKDSGGGLAS